MATKTLTADRSSMLARSDTGLNLGGGQDIHLACSVAGYDLRGLIGFTIPAGFWSDVKSITKGELLLTGSAVNHVARGATPTAIIRRLTAAFTANSSGESWSTNPTVYPGPAATTTGQVTAALPAGTGQVALDITTIMKAWAPTSVPGGGGAAMYGLLLAETGGAAQAAEVWSAEYGTASARPILRLTYTTNSPPASPTLLEPIGPDQAAGTFRFSTVDPEGDAITAYDLQVSTDPSMAAVDMWNVAAGTAGISGGSISVPYAGAALANGSRYYWRARARDAGGYGPWSSIATFVKGAGIVTPDAYDLWAQAILADMATGRTAIRLGTMRPQGEQVAQLVAAEYRDLFALYIDDVTPIVDREVRMLGLSVALGPDGWAVDAVVELIEE